MVTYPKFDSSRRDPLRMHLLQLGTFHGCKGINGAFVPLSPAERDRILHILEQENYDYICLGCGCTKTDRWLKIMGMVSCCDARCMVLAQELIAEHNKLRTRCNRKEPGKRQEWLMAEIRDGRGVNRIRLMEQFKCSRAQATLDMRRFIAANPDLLIYDRQERLHLPRARKAA